MKRIVDGLTYDTDTSHPIARSDYSTEFGEKDDCMCHGVLYRTPGGAFYEFQKIDTGFDGRGEETHAYRFVPMSAAAAQKWVLEGEVELIDETFVAAPEATEEIEATATIYLRAPATLKRRIDLAAAAVGLSTNAYMLRCAETCLGVGEAQS